jgi:hypothetical protein
MDPQPAAYDRVISKTDNGFGYRFTFNVDLRMSFARIDNDVAIVVDAEVPLGGFRHVVGTYDGTNMCLWVDGLVECKASSKPLADTVGKLYFGADSAGTNRFNGVLDEVAFYDEALTPETVQQHLQAAAR